jgi:hypothetical protein
MRTNDAALEERYRGLLDVECSKAELLRRLRVQEDELKVLGLEREQMLEAGGHQAEELSALRSQLANGQHRFTTADRAIADLQAKISEPVPMILSCPACGARHVDVGVFATKRHHTHACQGCGLVWRPAKCATVGVQFLPGYRDGDAPEATAPVNFEVPTAYKINAAWAKEWEKP